MAMESGCQRTLFPKVGQFLVQQLRIPADVEHPLAQLPPIVRCGDPAFRRVVLGFNFVVYSGPRILDQAIS